MKLLIGGASSKFFHLKEFGDSLEKLGAQVKLVADTQVYDGFPSRKMSSWFQTRARFKKLLRDFKPDAIFVDRQRHFAVAAAESGIPLFVHLRGDYWNEMRWARQTIYKGLVKRFALSKWDEMGRKCFAASTAILPICKYLADIVKENYPAKDMHVLQSGITPSRWFPSNGMKLKHPCVGLLQGAVIWGKTQEMLILPEILKAMPDVMFYWVGAGPYAEKVLPSLTKFENFKWFGAMQYPDQVRDFLSEIDAYGLMSGIDMSPLTLQEAQLMRRPVIATNVGGIPEIMMDGQTGFLVEKGDAKGWIDKIRLILNDGNKAKMMGQKGREFVESNFSWDKIAGDFISISKNYI